MSLGHSTRESDDQKRSQLERLKHKLARSLAHSLTHSLTHSLRFSSPIRGKREREREREREERTEKEGKQAAQALRPPAGVLMQRRGGVGYCWCGGQERSRVLPQEEGGWAGGRGTTPRTRAPVVRNRDAKRRDADSSSQTAAEGGREGGGAARGDGRRRTRRRPGREGKGGRRRRIVDVVKLQLSYTPASSPRSLACSLSLSALSHSLALLACVSPAFATWAYELPTHAQTDKATTDRGNCFL